VRGGELAEREALEVGPARLARDLERLARVALDALDVALPPADAREQRESLRARIARRPGEQPEGLEAERPAALDVGVAVQHDLGELRERKALDRPVAGRLGQRAHVLHLVRRGRKLPQPPGRACSVEPALQARLELVRTEQQPAGGAVRLAGERPAACALEHVGGLRPQVGRNLAVQLREERGRTVEVEGLGLDELVGRSRSQPAREGAVEPRALALGEPAVGDVADEDVAKAERRLARDRRERLARQQLAVDEVVQRRVDVEPGVELRDRAAPEDTADEGAVPHHRAGVGRQAVDARRDQRLNRVGDPHGTAVALLGEHPHGLLDEERVALRLLEQRLPQAGGQRRTRDEAVDELLRLVVGERSEVDRDRPATASAPAGPRLEQLWPGEAHDQDGSGVDAVGQVLDEVEQRLLRPVQVLEAQDERLRLRQVDRPLVRGPGDLLAAAGPGHRVEHTRGEAEQVRHGVARAGFPELLERLFRRVVRRDAGGALNHLGERPVRQALPEGKRAPREHRGALEPGEELAREPALAHPRVAEDGDELRTTVAHRACVGVLEQLELLLAPDVRRDDVERPSHRTLGAHDPSHLEAVAEALQPLAVAHLGDHAVGGEAVRGRADQDLAGGSRLLEAGGDVDRLPGGERRVAVLDDELAGLDADAHGQLAVPVRHDRHGGPDRPLGVVLVRGRRAEDGEHGVAGELLDGPAVGVDLRLHALEEARHPSPCHLGVARRDERRGVDEVDEQRRCELALHVSKSRFGALGRAGGLPHRGSH
jgi:hypothetical protein